jgi:glyoxylase-like metal-dependent hydrolase (beta-lactamase superfamily II)
VRPAPFDPAPLQFIPLPGHSPDHHVLWDPERRILAAGDLFLGVKVRVAHDHESPRTLVASLRTAAALEPRLLLDAHRGPLDDAASLLRAKIAWMEETIGAITDFARAGADEREIVQRVLGREDLVGYVSFGEYSKRAFVHTVLRDEGLV